MKKSTLLLLLLICNNIFALNSNVTSENTNNASSSVQILRLEYTSPNGAVRELVLGFTSNNIATEGVDYGYDASAIFPQSNDLNWIIEGNRYVIQGVGSFDDSKQYLLGMYNETSGTAQIALTSLEGFTNDIDVYIHDALLNTYTKINDTAYTETVDAADYTDRFYITFSQPETTDENNDNISSLDPKKKKKAKVGYLINSGQLKVTAPDNDTIKEIKVYNYNGNTLQMARNINAKQTYLNFASEEKNIILHIITEKETIIKQIVLNN
ncbi:hypothetical protein JAO71_06350 [Olleya sp. YSTF-M6]|uniref:Uncharacterized protein n=1 Tax=Olleya sediminilitoris TaxID=2795739 RepID=A0ABS1WJY0_9FLAO|nr:hypothetical protein [Olleya sediminilitoris]MBL7559425.1 hypothetical protein [Olleya sediminilitoris]